MVPGSTVEDLAECPPDQQQAARAALSGLHAAGIVHGDVRASNVLFSTEGGDMRVKLVDFECSQRACDAAPLRSEMQQDAEELELLLAGTV